jgi:Zn-dependent M28 family amino/carboxypeptidase
MLFAHWDSRPFADNDTKDRAKPIDGANDGGSGVGVLLEVARQLQIQQPEIGVDIMFFDAEDYGQPSGDMRKRKSGTWCLGSQYWARQPHRENYQANFGILLDMVGAPNAKFTREHISMTFAPHIVEKVWDVAASLGHGGYFDYQQTRHVGEDDHLYINKIRRIPSIDIIQYDATTGAFAPHWHTHDDNMDVIDKKTLAAVGETVLATVIQEAK